MDPRCSESCREVFLPDPHIHWPVIPRFREDGSYPKPVWAAERAPKSLPPAEQADLIAGIRRSLR